MYDDDDDQQDKVYVDCVVQAPEAEADCGLYTVISAVISCTHHSRHHHHHHHHHLHHQHYITTNIMISIIIIDQEIQVHPLRQ